MKKTDILLRGQFTLYALFMTVLMLIAYAVALYPMLDSVITTAGITGVEGDILSWSPLFLLLFILWGGLWYVNPQEGRR